MVGGNKAVRGVSGGEKKRVCIGNEILLNPSLLFLDEPTSGLDSTTALRIVQMLQVIAQVKNLLVLTFLKKKKKLLIQMFAYCIGWEDSGYHNPSALEPAV